LSFIVDDGLFFCVDEPITGITNVGVEETGALPFGRVRTEQPEEEIAQDPLFALGLQGQGGLDVWARVHGLAARTVAVLLGSNSGIF